jgi:hypothetical protein
MNENHISDSPEIFTFEGNQNLIFRFEEFLKKHKGGLGLPHGTPQNPAPPVETAALAAIEMLESFKKTVPHDNKKDYRNAWRQAIALGDILRKLENGARYPGFTSLWPHINLLLENCNFAQNTSHPKEDTDGDKVFELYTALLLLPLCSALEVDDPVHSAGGKNPDLIATIGGKRWAFACKVMHSDAPKSMLDRFEDGVRQIKAAKVDRGIIVISLKSVIPHDLMWPIVKCPDTDDLIYTPWPDERHLTRYLLGMGTEYDQSDVDATTLREAFVKRIDDDKVVPAVLLHLCTTAAVTKQTKPIPCMPRLLYGIILGEIPADAQVVLRNLNDSLHDRFVSLAAPAAAQNA